MAKTFILLAVLLLAFSVGIAYAFSGGGGSGRGSDDDSVAGAPPAPPSDDDSDRATGDSPRGNTQERSGGMMNARANMMYKIRDRVLECGNQSTMRERVECRLRLARQASQGLRHVPEDCRSQDDESERTECLELYDKVQPCRNLTTNDEKFACVRGKIGKTQNITSEYRGCQASENPTACMSLAKEKVHYMAKFRLYNLEHAAEKLLARGVSNETVTDFIAKLEQHKIDFDAAATKEAKQQVLRDTLADWKEFKKAAMEQLKKTRQSSRNETEEG